MNQMNEITKEKVNGLFNTDHHFNYLIETFNEKSHFDEYVKPILADNFQFNIMCTCTCESLLSRSYLFSSILIDSLICLNKIDMIHLNDDRSLLILNDHIMNDEQINELIFVEKNRKKLKYFFEINNLITTNKIMSKSNNKKKHKHLHPYLVYWYLIDELGINIDIASKFHSAQGIIRLCILYIVQQNINELSLFNKNDYERILEYYNEKGQQILNKRKLIDVLPKGANYEFDCCVDFINLFYNQFIDDVTNKFDSDILSCFRRLANYSISILRLFNECQNHAVNKKMLPALHNINDYLILLLKKISRPDEKKEAKQYYNFWIQNCKIINTFNKIELLNKNKT